MLAFSGYITLPIEQGTPNSGIRSITRFYAMGYCFS